jgi:hypothetical protein
MGSPPRRTARRVKRGLPWESLETRTLCAVVYGPSSGESESPTVYHDLGDVSQAVSTVGARAVSEIPAGESVAYRLVLSQGGDYLLWCRYTGDGVSLRYSGPGGSGEIEPAAPGVTNYYPLRLDAGEYVLTAESYGGTPATVDWELLSTSGVGQDPAIAPRLVDLSSAGSAASANTLIPLSTAAPVAASIGQNPSPPPSAWTASGQTSAGLVYDRSPIGRPSLDFEHVSVVGPTLPGGSQALAINSAGLPQVLALEPVPTTVPEGWSTASAVGAMFEAEDEPRSEADMDALVSAEGVLSLIGSWYSAPPGDVPELMSDGPLEASSTPARTSPLGPSVAPGKGTWDDPYATWMLPVGAMVVHSCVRLRRRIGIRAPKLPPRSWRPRSDPEGYAYPARAF